MEKTIKIDSKTNIKLSNNVGWMLIYRDQFGRDIVPVLIPVLNGLIDIALEVAKMNAKDARNVMSQIDAETLRDALFDMGGLEFIDFIHIVWAMAKAADDEIPDPGEWARSLPAFPVDTIGPVVFDLISTCMVSTKNLKRLRAAIASLKPEEATA